MFVSEVNIIPVKPQDGLVGFASVVIDERLYLSSIAIYTRLDGTYRILYPTKKLSGRIINLFHPINKEASIEIEDAICKKCKEVFEGHHGNDRYYQNSNSPGFPN